MSSGSGSGVKGDSQLDKSGKAIAFQERDVLDKKAFVGRRASLKGGLLDDFYMNTEYHKIFHKDKVDAYIDESALSWVNLPSSVNGTLIYFLMVELNHPVFDVEEFFYSLFFVGFPVFFTFFVQGLLLYNLMLNVPNLATDANICWTGPLTQHAVVGVFCIFLIPSFRAIIIETLVIMRCDEVCFDHHTPERKCIYALKNTTLKKILTFTVVVIPETIILLSLLFIGVGFILTSKDIGTIIINSVAIAFIMDIDNFCVEAFQTEEVTERANNSQFKIEWEAEEETFSDGVPHDHGTPEGLDKYYVTVQSFSNINKVVGVIIVSAITVFCIRSTYCIGDVNIAGDDVPPGQ